MRQAIYIYISIAFVLILQIMVWFELRPVQARWLNVPDAPSIQAAPGIGLGDKQLAYRYYALELQNAGDTGGRTSSLKNYDYDALTKWFYLGSALDDKSQIMPYLASYYFGGVQEGSEYKLRPLIGYLEEYGNSTQGERWKWLAQAAYLARYHLKDSDYALEIANKLHALNKPDMPIWAKQFPILIMEEKGEKQLALEMAFKTLETEKDKMQPSEILFLADHICNVLLSPKEAKAYEICKAMAGH